jgi:hypothetical protein
MRQLEFALTKLEISLDELIDALQFVLLGKVPMNLIRPNTLLEMLKNITMILPEGYEPIAGLSPNKIFLYYEIIQAVILAQVHSFKLALYVSLKTVTRHFDLYEIAVFPTHIFNNTYAKFVVEKEYVAINPLQRTYFAMSGMEILKCSGKDIMICPASQAVYSMEVDSCILNLYLLPPKARELCRRVVFTRPEPRRLERRGSRVYYHVAEPQCLHLQCQRNRTWETYSTTLQGSGVLNNAGVCFLTLPGLQLFPALEGEVDFSGRGPVLFTPTHPAVATQHETGVLQQMSLMNSTYLDQLSSSFSTHHIEADVNTLFHVHALAQEQVKGVKEPS